MDGADRINLVNSSVTYVTGLKESRLLGQKLSQIFPRLSFPSGKQQAEVKWASGKAVIVFRVQQYPLTDALGAARGNLELSLKSTNLPELFRPIVAQFRERALQKSVVVKDHFAKNLSPVLVDGFRISEVLTNLLDNALSYGGPGGEVEVSLNQKGGQIVTGVADQGPGIPPEALKHLFTKFYRVSNILGEGSKGTGLGLFICKSIVELHQGKIWVESAVGKGSRFFFPLPVAKRVESLIKK